MLVASSPDAHHQQSRLLAQGTLSPYPLCAHRGAPPRNCARRRGSGGPAGHHGEGERGRIGLPAHSVLTREAFNRNWEWLYIQLSWAEARQLPVIGHAVHAGCEPMLGNVEEFAGIRQVVFHWLKPLAEAVQEAASRRIFSGAAATRRSSAKGSLTWFYSKQMLPARAVPTILGASPRR